MGFPLDDRLFLLGARRDVDGFKPDSPLIHPYAHVYAYMGQARPWSLDPSPGLPAPGLGPGPDRAWDRAQGSPGPGAAAGGLGSCKVYVCGMYICMNVYVHL